jgi:tetratricopeptide (TPR) repeat protein
MFASMFAAVLVGAAPVKASAPSAAPQASYESTDDLVRALRLALRALEDDDSKNERVILTSIVGSQAFAKLEPELQYRASGLLAAAECSDHDYDTCLVHARQASESPFATALDWSVRFDAAYHSHSEADGIVTLRTIAEKYPGVLAQISDLSIISLIHRVRDPKVTPDGGYEFLSALFDAKWRPKFTAARPTEYWGRLVQLEVERGNLRRALEVVRGTDSPYVFIGLQVDRRYATLVAMEPALFDPARGAAAELARAQRVVDDNPNRLAAVNALASWLLKLGRAEEALKLLDEAVVKALPADGSRSRYVDPGQVNWTLDYRKRALFALGRYDDAIAEGQRAARHPENGSFNVSQAVDLADSLVLLGRVAEAKALVADLSPRDASPYGVMAIDEVRVCAAAAAGDTSAARATLESMAGRSADGVTPYENALLCVGDLDQLAALVIDRLRDPVTRNDALIDLQEYDEDTVFKTEFGRRIDAYIHQLRERPDLRAAVSDVGRIEHWPLTSPVF